MLIVPGSAAAQSALVTKFDPKAPPPRFPNGKPDFSGNWTRPAARDMTESFTNLNGTSTKGEPNPLPFTPWGQKQWDNYNPVKNGDFAGSCMPFGWIRSFHPHPMQIIHNNEWIAFLFEQSTMFQLVNTEGLPHRKNWPATWFGDSRGRWEGDKLVIEVVNFNGYATVGTIGHPSSDQAKLTMTFERPDMGRILFNWVLEDPKTYTLPIRNERVFVYSPQSSSWNTPAWRTTCSRCSTARSRRGWRRTTAPRASWRPGGSGRPSTSTSPRHTPES
jgi:hypothetical protein